MSLTTTTPSTLAENPTHSGSRRRPALIITDSGVGASLLVLGNGASPRVGTRFKHAGVTWRITAWREVSRAFVAEPVDQG